MTTTPFPFALIQGSLVEGGSVSTAYTDDGTVMLQLLHVAPEQSGEYICSASNDSGVATSTAILTVTGTSA